MAMFNSYVSHYQRVNLHFPMVFLWFSYGLPEANPQNIAQSHFTEVIWAIITEPRSGLYL